MAVKWDRPGSRHHGVVHYVHRDIVHDVPASQEEWRFCGQGKEKRQHLKLGKETEWTMTQDYLASTCVQKIIIIM